MKYGYARVSTTDQDASLQIDALQEHGCDEIFVDKVSGFTTERPELSKMCNQLHAGDTLVCWKLDRMFRSTIHALGQIDAAAEAARRGGDFAQQAELFEELGDHLEAARAFKKIGVEILGMSADSVQSHCKFIEKQSATVTGLKKTVSLLACTSIRPFDVPK